MYKIEGPEDGGKAPNGPNFLLIVILALALVFVGFAVALAVTGRVGRLIHPLHPDRHATSHLRIARPDRELAWANLVRGGLNPRVRPLRG